MARPRFQFRLRTLFVVMTVAAAVFWGIAKFVREIEKSRIVYGELIGQPLDAVLGQYGKPDTDAAEYRPLGPNSVRDIPSFGPIRTLIFHQSNGDLWVWFRNTGGEWTCFRSTWIGSNWQI
jgi:hypothetical protein